VAIDYEDSKYQLGDYYIGVYGYRNTYALGTPSRIALWSMFVVIRVFDFIGSVPPFLTFLGFFHSSPRVIWLTRHFIEARLLSTVFLLLILMMRCS